MSDNVVMDAWQELSGLSNTMMQLAEAGEWHELIERQTRYVQCVDMIRALEAHEALSDEELHQKRDLLEVIVDQDEKIRGLLTERRGLLVQALSEYQKGQKANKAYREG